MTLQDFRPKIKTAPEQLIDYQELLPMRLAQVRAGIRRRSIWSICLSRSWRAPHPNYSFARNATWLPQSPRRRDPYEHFMNRNIRKNPSAATNQEQLSEQ